MRQTELIEGLLALWGCSVHVLDNQPLPSNCLMDAPLNYRTRVREIVHPWDLDTLSREVLLLSGETGAKRLRQWNTMSRALNQVGKLDDECFLAGEPTADIMLHLHRIAHRQFHWQVRPHGNHYARALKVFGAPAVNAIAERELGMSTLQYLQFGAALYGHIIRDPRVHFGSAPRYADVLGLAVDATNAYFDRLAATSQDLREKLQATQRYDADWLYTGNPLTTTPLVRVDRARPERTICPITRHLFNRTSMGIYYDLLGKSGFDQALGRAFEAYIGDVLAVTCSAPQFLRWPETPYMVAGQRKDGTDWILSDDSGHIFIECKSKRLTVGAKLLTNASALERDIEAMAIGLAQLYLNLADALQGLTTWRADGRPCYPMIITLEDWYIFSPTIRDRVRAATAEQLVARGGDLGMLDTHPYTIASAADVEIAAQLIAKHGISEFMSVSKAPDRAGWSLLPMARADFAETMKTVDGNLFPSEVERLVPHSDTR